MKTEKDYLVEREQKLIQRNSIYVKAKSKKEAIEFARKKLFINAEFEMAKEKFRVIRE